MLYSVLLMNIFAFCFIRLLSHDELNPVVVLALMAFLASLLIVAN